MASATEPALKTYDFTVALLGASAEDDALDALAGALLKADCADTFIHSTGPDVFVDFSRKAGSLADAVASAMKDVERVGYRVARVEIETEDAG